jgi:hypothetical protein
VINQVLFLFGLFGFGVYFGLLFKHQLPTTLIFITGYLWGVLFWVVGGIILLSASIPYTPITMMIFFIILGSGIAVIHARNNSWSLSQSEITRFLLIALGFLLVIILASQINFTVTSQDSTIQIASGRRIAYEGFSRGVIEELSLRGIYLPLLQSASVFLGNDYLYAAQPAFAYTFILAFYFITQRIIGHLISNQRQVALLSLLTSLVLFSTYFIVFQFFYIHNSLISAAYLFLGVGGFWLAINEDESTWMILAMLGLLGFSLARNEAPLFALIFLVLIIGKDQIPYRDRLILILPYLGFLSLWYLYLLWNIGDGSKILDPEKTLVLIGTLIIFGLLVGISESKWIKRFLLPNLPVIMLGSLVVLLIFMVIQKPNHMMLSAWIMIKNLFESGGWGITWLVFVFLLVILLPGPRVPWEGLFFFGISSFIAMLLALVYFRNPFRLGWGDSANRMLTHILPVIVLYVLMKAAQGISERPQFEEKAVS